VPSGSPVTRFLATLCVLCVLGTVGIGVLVVVGILGGSDAAQAQAPTDIRGRWAWVSVVGSQRYPQTLTIAKQDLTTGAFSGVDKGNGITMNVTGKVTGDRFTLHLKQRGAPYTADARGTIKLKGGKLTMTGTFTDNVGHRGTFSAKGGAPPDAEPDDTPEPSPTPSPTPGNGLGYEDPPHNLHMEERPQVCSDPALVPWAADSIGRPRYLFLGRYRPCLLQLNPGTGSVGVTFVGTLTKWGSQWDRYRVDTAGGSVTRPDGRVVPITTWDFGTQSACFFSECAALYPWYNAPQVYWSTEDSRIEWVPVVTGTAALATNPDTGPQYARTTCVVGQPCEILVQRPPMLEQGVPYWVRLSVFGYCEERYTGVQGSCAGDGNTVAAREFLADAAPGGSAVGPTAAFLATQTNADAPWLFDAAGSTASAPATIVRYEWDLGDGFRTTSPHPTHEYAEPGRYHVTLTVTDSVGRSATVGQDIGEADMALIVNSTGDAPRGAKAGDACDTGEKIRGKPECTLRAAIQTSNLRDAASTITFAIRGEGIPVISHATKYPAITKPVIIDGTSQPGGWVQIAGASNLTFSGLNMAGGDSRITGMVISGFDTGLRLSGARNLVEGNRIGTNAAGTQSDTASFGLILSGATDTTIRDNVILANTHAVSSSDGASTTVTHNHIGVTESGRATGLEAGIFIGASGDLGGPWTITDNTIQANRAGIFMRGAGAKGSTISRNSIVVTIPPSRAGTFGVLLDGTPGVTISDNPSIVAAGGYDIAVTGVTQSAELVENGKGLIRIGGPDNEITGTVTGGDVTIRNNTLGLAADGSVPGVRSRFGVVSYGAASDVRLEGNVIAGHQDIEIELFGGAGHQVTGNNVGVDRAGRTALGGANGLFLGGVTDVLVQGNLISGIRYTAVSVGADYRAGDGPLSRNVTLLGNRIGTATDTRVALGNGTGIRIDDSDGTVIGPDNIISGNETGIVAGEKARGLLIQGNTIGADRARTVAVPNGVGIESSATGVTIEQDRVLGNRGTGIHLTGGTAEVAGNEIGIGAGSRPLGNKVGVWLTGNATAEMGANVVAFNGEDGIRIDRGAHGFVLLGSTVGNGGSGIGGDGALAAPRLDVVDLGSGATARRWFVVSGIGGIRTAHIYGNPDCDDPNEGPVPLLAKLHGANPLTGPTLVLSSPGRRSFPGYTVTVTDAATKDTSVFSDCVSPRQYPDTSGTGIPDIIQRGLGGDPTVPATVRFPADIGFITLETTHGRFANVAPGATAPSGTDLPLGAFAFQVTGLTPGDRDTVLLTSSDAVLRSYWRYGRETPSAPVRWYSWQYDAIGHTGPRLAGKQVILHIIEGGDGDDDGVANGVVQQ